MKNFIRLSLISVILLACGSAYAVQISFGIAIGPPPPPRVVHVIPRRPGPDFLWIEGYWQPVENHYRWHDGYWVRPPFAGGFWVSPRYDGMTGIMTGAGIATVIGIGTATVVMTEIATGVIAGTIRIDGATGINRTVVPGYSGELC